MHNSLLFSSFSQFPSLLLSTHLPFFPLLLPPPPILLSTYLPLLPHLLPPLCPSPSFSLPSFLPSSPHSKLLVFQSWACHVGPHCSGGEVYCADQWDPCTTRLLLIGATDVSTRLIPCVYVLHEKLSLHTLFPIVCYMYIPLYLLPLQWFSYSVWGSPCDHRAAGLGGSDHQRLRQCPTKFLICQQVWPMLEHT